MTRTRLQTFVPLLATVLALGSGAALARDNTPLDRVEISGQHLRVDVSRTCPTLAEDLGDALARNIHLFNVNAEYQVRFDLKGGEVSEVQALGGPFDYRHMVRNAMRKVGCHDAQTAAAPQRFAFVLAIRNGEDLPAAQRFAIRELPQPLTASAN